MVNFPETDPKTLPEFELTSTQQKFQAKQTEMLTAKRTWKSSQMGFHSVASRFKTYLARQFGEDYISGMLSEFGGKDYDEDGNVTVTPLNFSSPLFKQSIQRLMGPFADGDPVKPSEPTYTEVETVDTLLKSTYDEALAAYQEEVADRKTYLGVATPDADTCQRMLTLLIKMHDYEAAANAAEQAMIGYAIESIGKGEIPTASILRTAAAHAQWSWRPRPIDYNSLGAHDDNPTKWRGDRAMYKLLLYSHYSTEGATFRGTEASLYPQYRVIAARRNANPGHENLKRLAGLLWRNYWATWNKHKFGIETRTAKTGVGGAPFTSTITIQGTEYIESQYNESRYHINVSGGKVWLGPMVMFYAKAYGRTADPLQFWTTHSKYRLVSENRGDRGVFILLTQVDARFGAQSGRAIVVANFPPGTDKGKALANMRRFYPYVMDIETGNNPKLDKLIGDSVVTSKITKAGAEFAKLPPSSRDGMRFVAVATTYLSVPLPLVFRNDFAWSVTSTDEAHWKQYNEGSLDFRFWAAKAGHSGALRASKFAKDFDPTEIMKVGFYGLGGQAFTYSPNYFGYNKGYGQGFDYSKFSWPTWIKKATDWYRSYGDWGESGKDKNTMAPAEYITEKMIGWPNPHPDARIITTLNVYLVPESFEEGLGRLYQIVESKANKFYKTHVGAFDSGYEDVFPESWGLGFTDGRFYIENPPGASPTWKGKTASQFSAQPAEKTVIDSNPDFTEVRFPNMKWIHAQVGLLLAQSGHPYSNLMSGKSDPWTPHTGATLYDQTGVPFSTVPMFDTEGKEIVGSQYQSDVNIANATSKLMQELGLKDTGEWQLALSTPVNDPDDIHDIMSDFKQAFPGVSELVYPDADDSLFTPSMATLNGRVASVRSTSRNIPLPGISDKVSGTIISARVPINTKGFSGKRYTLDDYLRQGFTLKYGTNADDLLNPPEVSFSTIGNTMFIGGLAIAGMIAYKGLKKSGL